MRSVLHRAFRLKKTGNQTYADFQAAIPQAQYRKWQLTGMQIPITVTASLPRYWGGGIYKRQFSFKFPEHLFADLGCFRRHDKKTGKSQFEY